MNADLLNSIELIYEDTAIPLEVVNDPDRWFARPIEERAYILNEISLFLYGTEDDNGIINIDLSDPEAIG